MWLEAHYPAIAQHLAPYAVKAAARSDQGRYWWELRPCDYYSAFEQPKIVFPDIALRANFTFDTANAYAANTAYLIPIDAPYPQPFPPQEKGGKTSPSPLGEGFREGAAVHPLILDQAYYLLGVL